MLQKVKIIHFRSIENMDLYFQKSNAIIWKNGAGKTNILQAISYLFFRSHTSLWIEDVLKNWEKYMYLEGVFLENNLQHTLGFSFDQEQNKKIFTLNGKKVTKKHLFENILKVSYFSPTHMNLFYLGPKMRRDFLDEILTNIFPEYDSLLKAYEKIVKNRNRVLKNIFEEKSKKEEIEFWNKEFILLAKKIYEYRIPLGDFIWEQIIRKNYFLKNPVENLNYEYISKVDLSNIEKSMQEYLDTHFERDIILGKTHIWPHIDDFNIRVDGKELVSFASRWEIKSIIISLKLIEIEYIRNKTGKTPLLLIDDLWSELDSDHIDLLLQTLSHLQIIYTSITALEKQETNNLFI